jgi:MFS family permease
MPLTSATRDPLLLEGDRTPLFWPSAAAAFIVASDNGLATAAYTALSIGSPDTPHSALSWMLTGYALVYAALLIPAGRLATAWGAAHTARTGFLAVAFSAAAAACAPDALCLIAARLVHAAGASLLTPASLTLLLAHVPAPRRGRTIAAWTAAGASGATLGPFVGGWLTQHGGWRTSLAIIAPIATAAWFGIRRMHDAPGTGGNSFHLQKTPAREVLRTALLMACIATGIHTLQQPAAFAGGIFVLTAALAWWSHRDGTENNAGPSPWASPAFRRAALASLIFGATFGATLPGFYILATGVWHYSPMQAGLAAAVGPATATLAMFSLARWADQIGVTRLLQIGGLCLTGGSLWQGGVLAVESAEFSRWLPGQIVAAVGVGLILPTLTTWAINARPASDTSEVQALTATLRQVGGAIGMAGTLTMLGQAPYALEDFRRLYLLFAASGAFLSALAWQEKRPIA